MPVSITNLVLKPKEQFVFIGDKDLAMDAQVELMMQHSQHRFDYHMYTGFPKELKDVALLTRSGGRYYRWTNPESLSMAFEALRMHKGFSWKRPSPKKTFLVTDMKGEAMVVSEVTDSLELSESDILIAVMGPTGAGKSTFIKNATGYHKVEIGDDLASCTRKIHVFR
ncbi:hypothetical protein CVT24_013037, partial [Panaeolus cyanescens]